MINIMSKASCTGCTACSSICPKKAIDMKEDKEGFMYPIVDKEKCINCGKCNEVCPMQNNKRKEMTEIYRYACQTNNEDARKKSTSGGSFYVISKAVLKRGGIIWAAGFDKKANVIHKKAKNIDEISDMMGSKYVQSELKKCFIEIKDTLSNNIPVLFVGTPCQVEGLINYVGKTNRDLLYTVDLVCYGVPSPGIYRKWINMLEHKYNSKVNYINFRDKKYGYFGTNIKILFDNKKELEDCRDAKSFLKTMFSNIGLRPSCYDCPFRIRQKKCDFTIGDIWNIGNYSKKMDDNKGTTLLQINTNKGKELLEQIKSDSRILLIESLDAKKINDELKSHKRTIIIPKNREYFFEDANLLEYQELMNKYFPKNKKDFLANRIKPIVALIPGNKYFFKFIKTRRIKINDKKD